MTERKRRVGRPAGELVAELEADPVWRAARDARLRGQELRARRNDRDSAPLIAQLKAAGVDADTLSELVNGNVEYQVAIPLLIDWLPRMKNRDMLEAIVRALAIRPAKPMAGKPLIEAFDRAEDSWLQWAIANSLEVVADDSVFDDLLRLTSDPRSGRARQMLALALGRFPKRAAAVVPVLTSLLDDEDVNGHAVMALGRLRVNQPALVQPFENDSRAWVRSEARKALRRMQAVSPSAD
jgi:HEAT repeat protein